MKLRFIHSSGRYDIRSAKTYDTYRSKAEVVTHTECQGERGILGGYGWGAIHGADVGPRSDPAIEYNKKFLECIEKFILPISDIEYKREGGSTSGKLFAAVGVFYVQGMDKLLVQSAIHMPRWSQPERRGTYFDGVRNLTSFLEREYPDDYIRISADWNRDLKNFANRKSIARMFKPLKLEWDWIKGNFPKVGGTFQNKFYDGSLISKGINNIDTFLLPDNNESDHRPYKSELGFYS